MKNEVMRIRSRYNLGPREPGLDTGKVSQVQQSAAADCDINNLMRKYEKTGVLPERIQREPEYGDFANTVDYQEALNLVLHAQEQFAGLPAPVRARFKNDPAEFLAFTNDEANLEEMGKLGLLSEAGLERLEQARIDRETPDPAPASKERQAPQERSPKAKKPDASEG